MAEDSPLVYTTFGYGTVVETRATHTVVKLRWGAMGYFRPESVSTEVPFTVKSFAGAKPELAFRWAPATPFKELYSQLAVQLALPPHMYSVLYYPKGCLKTILPSDSPASVGLAAGARLVAIAYVKRQKFAWNEAKKGANLALANSQMTVTKQNDDSYETILGSLALAKGNHYWEITIDCFVEEEDFFIGVAAEGICLTARPSDTGLFWGFLGSGAVKLGPDGHCQEYGDPVKTGDVVGVSLEYADELGTLSFSKNGTDFGVAFTDVPANVYPALSLFYTQAQVTLGFR